MALARLGHPAKAEADLARRQEIQRTRWTWPAEGAMVNEGHDHRIYVALRCEAEAVVLFDPIFPADPFKR